MLINEVTDTQRTHPLTPYKNQISSALRSDVKLYRGIQNLKNSPVDTVSLQTMRRDRLPRDTSRLGVFIFDAIMQGNRWPFRKSNTTSITNNWAQAKLFGGLCRVYPVDGTVFLYSTEVSDWYPSINRIMVKIFVDAAKSYPELKVRDNMYNLEALLGYPDYITKWIGDNLPMVNDTLDMHVTTDINELQYAIGEILMWAAAKHFVAVRIDNEN